MAPRPVLGRCAVKTAHEHAISNSLGLLVAFDILGLEALQKVFGDGVAHPFVKISDHIMKAELRNAFAVFARGGKKARRLIEVRTVEMVFVFEASGRPSKHLC